MIEQYRLRSRLLLLLAIVVTGDAVVGRAAESKIAFLVAQGRHEKLTPESDTARELAERLISAAPLWPAEGGKFVDRDGRDAALERFSAVWCHRGEDVAGPIAQRDTLDALRRYVHEGHGLLLSGMAAALVAPLELETLQTQPMTFGHDRAQAGLTPVAAGHPAFRGLDLDRDVLWMSNAVFPAFAQFRPTSRPPRGQLLAQSPGPHENPLVEFRPGRGRVVVMAWRLSPHYHVAARGMRENFERLTENLLRYLAQPAPWEPAGDGNAAQAAQQVRPEEWQALRLAIDDLCETFGDRYPRGAEYQERLRQLEGRRGQSPLVRSTLRAVPANGDGPLFPSLAAEFRRLRSEALLANPLLDFDRLLLIKRGANKLGLPTNYQSNSSLPPAGYDNEIAVLSPVRPDGKLTTLYRPSGGRFAGDVDLHFDADRLLFSMPDEKGRWQVWEIGTDGTGLRQLPLISAPDVDNYDACYLPDGRIVFTSTAPMVGVPCVRGSAHVANLFLLEGKRGQSPFVRSTLRAVPANGDCPLFPRDGAIRQLTVEQDHDWCPRVLPDGRVLYLRWEYTDIPHAFARRLFSMNPDGTGQTALYGSNSYWPATMFYARPVPGHPTKLVAVVGGHHELPRMGDLVVFDPARGSFEAEGVVQRIPGRGRKVEPVILDLPIAQTWPKFLHPWPLSEKYFLVSCKPSESEPWGIYLVDVFDNVVPIFEEPGYAMLEPVPIRQRPRPPRLPDRVDLSRRDAEVFLADVYDGPGLRGVSRGTVKSLRLVSYQFAYQGMGGEPDAPGLDGPWDVKRVLGTVPVCDDGSARFLVPAYTPIAVQPLDSEGKAVQLMRSWFTAMPGEVLSCAGCHEKPGTTPALRTATAAMRPPEEIRPWHGPARGFDFRREVQPVLDKLCLGCHDGRRKAADGGDCPDFRGGEGPDRGEGSARRENGTVPLAAQFVAPDLSDRPAVPTLPNKNAYNLASRFTPSYYALRKLVRTPTRESDMYLLMPWEFHADTTHLVQMLQKGHYGVQLDAESWDRLVTWIDLNAPAHGTWTDICGESRVLAQRQRRRELRRLYTGMDEDPEAVVNPYQPPPAPTPAAMGSAASLGAARVAPLLPAATAKPAEPTVAPGGAPVTNKQTRASPSLSIELARGIALELVRIPAGRFVMGQADGCPDERPPCPVAIERPFWLGRCEITNQQFALFDPGHKSGLEHGDYIQFSPGERGWTLSRARQPVVRVSWRRAMEFCRWLSQKTGRTFDLPTEAQWEYACRAGTTTPWWYGTRDTDFSPFANLSDATHQAIDPFGWSGRTAVIPPWRPADTRFNDHARVSAPVGTYAPNPWGLHDMHGNVAEWTRSGYLPYPYDENDGRNAARPEGKKVVRGGSWYDPPDRCRSAFRLAYRADQGVYNVGFRVMCSEP